MNNNVPSYGSEILVAMILGAGIFFAVVTVVRGLTN